jgi:small conductance mechanosensitive channel
MGAMMPSNPDPVREFLARHVPILADVPVIGSLLVALVVVLAGWAVSRWLRRLTERAFALHKLDPALARTLLAMVRFAVLTATLVVALDLVGFKTTSLLTIVASAGLAVGLALQGTLTNFASGVLLLVFRPFTLGHKVSLAGNVGVVKDISLFFTTVVTPENKTVSLQNSAVTGAPMVNFSMAGTLRGFVDVGVPVHDGGSAASADSAGSAPKPSGTPDVAGTTALLLKAAKGADRVRQDPPPEVVFNGLAGNALQFTVSAWGAADDLSPMLEAVQRALLAELSATGADLATVKIALRVA